MNRLAYLYDSTLAEKMKAEGYDHAARGLYARSESAIVWRGLWVSFHQAKSRLSVQPSLSIFCPEASKIVKEGLDHIYEDYRSFASHASEKLGSPFINYLLYDRAYVLRGADRHSYSYDVEAAHRVDGAVTMIWEDFSQVADVIFNGTSTMRELRDRIVTENPLGTGTGAAMDAMALTYLIDGTITAAEIDQLADIRPSPMTTKFGDYMKKKVEDFRRGRT